MRQELFGVALAGVGLLQGAACAFDAHVFGDPKVLQQPPERSYHVQNYRLGLRLDQAKGEVFGDERVTLQPLAKGFNRFYLNSAELTIDAVTLEQPGKKPVPLPFESKDPYLWITLDRGYDPADTLNLHIVYHGVPRFGLFFTRPTADDPRAPAEVWSQGEAEFNRYWFPCWDYPNDMSTSETVTTVPEGQSVVSNGRLVRVTRAAGQVTYDWVESIPHSSYLISIAAGPWKKFSDSYHHIPVDYYVADGVDEATARRSFNLTPDMLGFFSRATGVEYPYEQYAQVTVHNYFFGGMENVSATTLTDGTLHDERAESDFSSQALVAHEMGQHWFGDLVQGRDWANIWLNEGFATYMEALYTQYHQGNDAFRLEMRDDQLTEQEQDRDDYRRPIVDYHYSDAMDMFDSITHERGAVILDMLRNVLDGSAAAAAPASQQELFFKGLNAYLVANRTQAVDTSALIKALQTTTGQDLGWFFHEWVFMGGHPDYRVEARYDSGASAEVVTVTQTQPVDSVTPLFDMPVELAFHGAAGESKRVRVRDDAQLQTFTIPLAFQPQWVDFDPDDIIDKSVVFEQPRDALLAKVQQDPAMMSRLDAATQLAGMKGNDADAAVAVLAQVLDRDPFYGVRSAAAKSLAILGTASARTALLAALHQEDNRVRAAVIRALGAFHGDQTVYPALVDTLDRDPSYAVEGAAAEALGASGMPGAFAVLQAKAATGSEIHLMGSLFAGLAATRDSRAVPLLMGYARPGVPERIRLGALDALAQTRAVATREDRQALMEVTGAALRESFVSVQQAGVRLAGAFGLTEFRGELETEAETAPTAFQRDTARQALAQIPQ